MVVRKVDGKATRCILYIVRRTQLYLDQELWNALHAEARRNGTTISELVRQAVRERYAGDQDERRKAMLALVGIRQSKSGEEDSTSYIRRLRKDTRLDRLRP